MESMTNAALVGSARASLNDALPSATPEGRLVGSLSAESVERRLLLAAGARAIYRQAGYKPKRLTTPLEPAPAETRRVCPANAVDLMHQLFTERASELLREALGRMIAAGLILPPEILPLALGSATVAWDREMIALRPLIAQVVGERGAWLGRFNSAWAWVHTHRLDELSPRADTIWQEGKSGDRASILRQWRTHDPAKARTEIAAVWRQEKADFRVEMITALEVNLSGEDEPLLETALDDRSANVRVVAQRLLARVPGSAFRARAIHRADALLSMSRKKLVITPPEAHEKSWERDGISPDPDNRRGEQVSWLVQIVAATPPTHWVERFDMAPADLIAAATGEHFSAEVLEGWARATMLYDARDWIQPLVAAWRERLVKHNDTTLAEWVSLLLPKLPEPVLDPLLLKIVREGESKQDIPWRKVAPLLPRPWSVELARAWLAGLRAFAGELASLKGNVPDWWEVSDRIANDNYSLPITPSVLPEACLDEALEPWDIGENNKTWHAITWREEHERFLRAVRLRQRIRDEIPGGDMAGMAAGDSSIA
ncbi:MAG TPA: DUF5691 domain-containing protein [Ktedonobacterales bacterium]